MARRPQSREADNRARSGRQGRTSGAKQSNASKIAGMAFDNPIKNVQRAVQNIPPVAVVSGLVQAGQKGRAKGGYVGGVKGTARESGKQIALYVGGGVATKAAGKVLGAVGRTPLGQRGINVITRQKVMVHGTPGAIEGKYVLPKSGSPGSPKEAVVFGWNPRHRGSRQFVPSSAREYTQGTGSAVVAKVPKSSLKSIHAEKGNVGAKQTPWIVSKSPARVVSQVPANSKNYESELAKALKRAGAPLRGPKKTPIKDMRQRAKTRSANKRSVV